MRAKNMQALTDAIKRRYPGVVIYGIGDAAHKLTVSGHNEDDTPGVRAELQDTDTVPEHRAIDVMLGTAFKKADADALVSTLVGNPIARARLYYIIFYGYIWSRSHGWVRRAYGGSDPHTNHVHISGWSSDDENAADWPMVGTMPVPKPIPKPQPSTDWTVKLIMALPLLRRGSKGEDVQTWQGILSARGISTKMDGVFGPITEANTKTLQRKYGAEHVDGIVGPETWTIGLLRKDLR